MIDNNEFRPMIGLEIHCQLNKLKTKLFCSCNAQFRGEEPNIYTCPVCLGLPGSLPTVNREAINHAILLGLALKSKINKRMFFFRKNYFYPDLPQNFQITQYNKAGGVPFAEGGIITINLNGTKKDIHLDRFHLENDPGKLLHIGGDIEHSKGTLIDYNRCGVALVEIVTKPELESPEEARIFLNKLRSIISHLGIIDVNMDGAIRVDANISIRGHARVEIKNINSFKDVEKALKWEITRQINLLKSGKEVEQSTRNWNGKTTTLLREKESENEYRYFPEADLVPILIKEEWIERAKKNIPELPDERIIRFKQQYSLNDYDAEVIVSDKSIADFYEQVCKLNKNYELIKNYLVNDILGLLNEQKLSIEQTKIKPNLLADLITELDNNTISSKIAKKYLPEILNGVNIKTWLKKQGVSKISDEKTLNELTDKVINENPNVLNDLKKKPQTFEFFVGQIMKYTKGQADPDLTRKILKEKLKNYLPN